MSTPLFHRYIGIDYSGAKTATDGLPGLRVYAAVGDLDAAEIVPPSGPSRYWSRRGLAEWLQARLQEDIPTIVGIDHAFSFPLAYFDTHRLALDWHGFLEDFHHHWPTDADNVYVDFVRDGSVGLGNARGGDTRWRRVTERRAGAAKSVFHFDVQGQVAKSTHSGLPWLLHLRRASAERVHFWPFDGWEIAPGRSAVVEVYPSLWSRAYDRETRTADQHDAYSVARRMRDADRDGDLSGWLVPALSDEDRRAALVEGWILGVGDATAAERRLVNVVRATIDQSTIDQDDAIGPAGGPATVAAEPVRTDGKLRIAKATHRVPADVHRFLITLHETDPVVWRRIEVPARYSFWDLHVAIQDAMGWKDYHLHEFTVVHPKKNRLVRIGIPDDEDLDAKPCVAGWRAAVSQYVDLGVPPMLYVYDFGDDWRHSVAFEGTWSAEPGVQYPLCTGGARRCPPEDCGGAHGFREFLDTISNPEHPEHDATLRWAGGHFDPAAFDPASVRFDDPRERWETAFGDETSDG